MCRLHNHLAQWEKAIEWCNKAIAGNHELWWAFSDLAAANAWAGRDKEAKEAAAQLKKLQPGFTIWTWGAGMSDDATFHAQGQRIGDGLRKAGLQ
jgi:Flp pilus assembly protein TadD